MSETRDLAADVLRGTEEIAAFIGESRSTVRHLLEHGHLPGFRLGSGWRMRRSAYLNLIEKKEQAVLRRLEEPACL